MSPIEPSPEPKERSSHWGAVRKAFLKTHPACAACGKTRLMGLRTIDVHHIKPYHIRQDLELDPNNLITLCRKHHLQIGHLGNWEKWNVEVVDSCKWFALGIAYR